MVVVVVCWRIFIVLTNSAVKLRCDEIDFCLIREGELFIFRPDNFYNLDSYV